MADARQLVVKTAPFGGSCVVYVMSRDQRVQDNHALLVAQEMAAAHGVPLYVLFVLKKIAARSREHYEFMLAGLESVAADLQDYDIPFVLRSGDAHEEILKFTREVECGALFFDFSPLTFARTLVKNVASNFAGPVTVVDTHNVVPVWAASQKQEFAAHTMRPKIHRLLEYYLVSPPPLARQQYHAPAVASPTFDDARQYLQDIPAAGISLGFAAGEAAARAHLEQFITERLEHYAIGRNDPADEQQSGLSPYLHFGQISSLRVALEVMAATGHVPLLFQRAKMAEASGAPSREDGMNALFEEMIVRKELSDNFCLYGTDYASLEGAPQWARDTLAVHASDPRDFVYTSDQWEEALTHDGAWNAAQRQLTRTGKIHGYMRMYWAKKILEWSTSPDEALQTAIYLNDKYSIDGGDPNGYVGVLWSIAGLHDRPWFERSVYGKIRYMNASGLQRKFDLEAYIKRWS